MATITILLSHERSGSHFLGEFLSSLSNVAMFDEVCNPDAVKPEHFLASFHRFKYDAIVKDPDFLLNPTHARPIEFVTAYFDQLLALRAPRGGISLSRET